MADDGVRATVTVPVPPERAFDVFGPGFGTWWPTEYTWAQSELDRIFLELWPGGRCVERNLAAQETVWGTVLACDAPDRLAFAWQITPDRQVEPDPGKAGTVEVRFVGDGAVTRVDLEHREFARYGQGWQGYRDAMASPQGWPYCLDRYVAACR